MLIRLSRALPLAASGALPTAFPVLFGGVNETTKGPVVLDDAAIDAVIAEQRKRGVPVVIDLEHDSINPLARAMRSDAADARGRGQYERRGHDLYIVNATWTPDGARRLRERTQNYISAVAYLDEDSRVTRIHNLALVADPATHNAAPLIASRKALSKGSIMDPKLIAEAIDALEKGDAKAALDLLKRMIADAAGAGAESEAPAEGEALAENAELPPKEEEETPLAAALSATLLARGDAAIVAEVKRMSAQLKALELAREADDHNERIALIGELVKLGAELPCTAWSNPEKLEPVESLRKVALSSLRSRVAAFRAAPGRVAAVAAPQSIVALSDEDRARADQIKDPSARERFVAARTARANRGVK